MNPLHGAGGESTDVASLPEAGRARYSPEACPDPTPGGGHDRNRSLAGDPCPADLTALGVVVTRAGRVAPQPAPEPRLLAEDRIHMEIAIPGILPCEAPDPVPAFVAEDVAATQRRRGTCITPDARAVQAEGDDRMIGDQGGSFVETDDPILARIEIQSASAQVDDRAPAPAT